VSETLGLKQTAPGRAIVIVDERATKAQRDALVQFVKAQAGSLVGEVVAAVGTAGASPMLATMLRHDIETRVPEGAGRVAALFRNLQNEVRDALPEAHRRRAFLRAALTGPAAQAALTGDMDAAVRRLREALAKGEQGLGVVQLLDARGPNPIRSSRGRPSACSR
jgi:hypothetical protein